MNINFVYNLLNLRSVHLHRIVFEPRLSSVMHWATWTTSAARFLNTSN